jgi:hypothetical protein
MKDLIWSGKEIAVAIFKPMKFGAWRWTRETPRKTPREPFVSDTLIGSMRAEKLGAHGGSSVAGCRK